MKEPVIVQSISNHQMLVDAILKYKKENGFCYVSKKQLEKEVNHCSAWIDKAIKRLNTEEICVEYFGYDCYKIHYENILKKGVFNTILYMIYSTLADESLLFANNETLMKRFGVSLKVVQMYRAYISPQN